MKRLIIISSMLLSLTAYGQNANEQANNKALAAAKFGSFEYSAVPGEGINVNYSFSPAEPAAEVAIMLQSSDINPLSVKIKDDEGKIVKEWTPSVKSDFHKATLNIADLSAGTYSYNIYWDDNLAKTISFLKK